MRRPPFFSHLFPSLSRRSYSSSASNALIISIQNGTFYRQHPSSVPSSETSKPPLFPDLTFNLPSAADSQHWTIVGPSSSGKTTLLEILRGQHLSFPPTARSFPYLSSPEIEAKDHRLRFPGRAVQYVGFGGGKGGPLASGFAGAYLSARYESRREETDFSLIQYLKGETDLNPPEEREGKDIDDGLLDRVVNDLGLSKLLDMSVENLSNGQTRRARIARALLGRPEVLLLDEPFSMQKMGIVDYGLDADD
jgi:ABC-type glutathione transport system ATPase component